MFTRSSHIISTWWWLCFWRSCVCVFYTRIVSLRFLCLLVKKKKYVQNINVIGVWHVNKNDDVAANIYFFPFICPGPGSAFYRFLSRVFSTHFSSIMRGISTLTHSFTKSKRTDEIKIKNKRWNTHTKRNKKYNNESKCILTSRCLSFLCSTSFEF